MSNYNFDDIILEYSDEKGMIYLNALMNYLPKAKKAVCEIHMSKGLGSGFFCKIPYTEDNNIFVPVLLTNHHLLSRDYLNSNNYIKITINDEIKNIPLKQRKIWINEQIDFTCIEIKEEEDKIHTFFNLDDNALYSGESNDCYLNQYVLIFAINKNDKQIGLSNGKIKKKSRLFFCI